MKQCKKCEQTKPLDQFNDHHTNLDGKSGHCRECQREDSRRHYRANKPQASARYKQWASENRERVKELNREWVADNKPKLHMYHIKKTYGISIAQYERMLQDQGHKCKICPAIHSEKRKLNIDHDHETGLVRGLLCLNCNRMLGFAKDRPATLLSAVAYLENNSQNDTKSILISNHSTLENDSLKKTSEKKQF